MPSYGLLTLADFAQCTVHLLRYIHSVRSPQQHSAQEDATFDFPELGHRSMGYHHHWNGLYEFFRWSGCLSGSHWLFRGRLLPGLHLPDFNV